VIFVEQAVGGCHAAQNHIAQWIEEPAFIVAGAVEPGAAGQAARGNVEHPAGELAHRLAVGRDRVERQPRHVVA